MSISSDYFDLDRTIKSLLSWEREGGVMCLKHTMSEKGLSFIPLRMRTILVDWLLSAWKMFKLKQETFYLTCSILDVCLRRLQVDKENLQLVGITSLMLAAKKSETYPPEIIDYIYILDGAYTVQQLTEMEKSIFQDALGFNMELADPIHLVRLSSGTNGCFFDFEQHTAVRWICLYNCLEPLPFLPSVIASAANMMVCKMYIVSFNNIFMVEDKVLEYAMERLYSLIKRMKKSTLTSITNIKSYGNHGDFVSKIESLNMATKIDIKYLKLNYPDFFIQTHEKNIPCKIYKPTDITTCIVLGEGTFGKVKKANISNCDYAKKKIDPFFDENEGYHISFIKETSLLTNLSSFNHPNIIKFDGIVFNRNEIIMELMEGDMNHYYKTNETIIINSQFRYFLFGELLKGLDFIHNHGFIHRDIKPQNILYKGIWNENTNHNALQIKYCDFGLVKGKGLCLDAPHSQEICTRWYRPIEMFREGGCSGVSYHTEVDMWSLSCTLYEIITGKILFCGDCNNDQVNKILQLAPFIKDDKHLFDEWEQYQEFPKINISTKLSQLLDEQRIQKPFSEIIIKGLTVNPLKRPTAKVLLELIDK